MSTLNIQTKHIKKMEKIGDIDGISVHMLLTYGGLVILAKMESGEPEILAMSPHILIAKDIVEKKFKRTKWNDND